MKKTSHEQYWPTPTPEQRPWTRWWWLGSAVDPPTIRRLLETYRAAGLGGVEITSIYGVRGGESRNIPYLSPDWTDRVRHAIDEAHRLGMEVDLPPGSGWRIGGPFLTPDAAASKLKIEQNEDGTNFRAEILPSGERVKRAGPGGEGLAFNPFRRDSLDVVIRHFSPVFRNLGIRAQFHDSWEYASDACPELFEAFLASRGYDLRRHLAALAGEDDPEEVARVRYDFRCTLADLALEGFLLPWTEWCHALGQQSRNQAHGSPGNLLDLYAAADIPETEVFREVTEDTPLVSKFASSAAHVTGKSRVSSETGTWIGEHFQVSLATLKKLVDNLFVSGINHHVYHGTAYSPPEAEWPGHLFYASVQLNPANPIWRDFPKLNEYVTRCQTLLQRGIPDNDLLVYFPIHDLFHCPGGGWLRNLTIRGDWLNELSAAGTFRTLWRRGVGFDYVSDRQIRDIERSPTDLPGAAGARYRALLVPPCRYLPVETLDCLRSLARRRANVVFLEPLPTDVPGRTDLASRRARFARGIQAINHGADLLDLLRPLGVREEPLAGISPHLLHIRRRDSGGLLYFVANQGNEPIHGWISLATPFASARIMDPLSGRIGRARVRAENEVFLQLDPGASLFLRLQDNGCEESIPEWEYHREKTPWKTLKGPWRVDFIKGGPTLPASRTVRGLSSWTEYGSEAERFAGTARYRLRFDAGDHPGTQMLDLGQVHASARVSLNGTPVDTLIGPTFRTLLHGVRPTGNLLDIEVTNLAANRIRDLDRRGVDWKRFDDINIVNRDYQPFDASDWSVLPSGLLGPMRVRPAAGT